MRLLLHIGTHKTGTTAIQRFCAQNRKALRSRGLWYPDYDIIGAEGHYAHHHLADAVAGLATSRGSEAEAARFFAAVRERAATNETVMISAESCWRLTCPAVDLSRNEYHCGGGEAGYWTGRRAFVKRLASMSGTEGVEIVAVLRRQDDCAESMFKERVKGTSYAEPFDAFCAAFAHRFRYFDQLSVWADVFPKVTVLVYEDLARADLVAAFFQALDVSHQAEASAGSRANTSLNNDLVAFKRLLNRGDLKEADLYKIAELMQGEGFAEDLTLDGGSTWWAGEAQRHAFLDRFEDQNARVQGRFTSLDRATLFPPSSEPAKPTYPGLSAETSAAISRRIDQLRVPRRGADAKRGRR